MAESIAIWIEETDGMVLNRHRYVAHVIFEVILGWEVIWPSSKIEWNAAGFRLQYGGVSPEDFFAANVGSRFGFIDRWWIAMDLVGFQRTRYPRCGKIAFRGPKRLARKNRCGLVELGVLDGHPHGGASPTPGVLGWFWSIQSVGLIGASGRVVEAA